MPVSEAVGGDKVRRNWNPGGGQFLILPCEFDFRIEPSLDLISSAPHLAVFPKTEVDSCAVTMN